MDMDGELVLVLMTCGGCQVTEDEVARLAEELNCTYHLISCRRPAAVDEVFSSCLRRYLELYGNPEDAPRGADPDGKRCSCQIM